MNKAERSEPQNHLHQLRVQRRGIRDLCDLAERKGVDERHDDGVAALGAGLRDREAVVAQRFHEGVFLQRGQARHVHPAARGALAQVVAVGLDGAEGDAAEAMDLEDVLGAGGVGDDEDVGFFADADLVADGVEVLSLEVRVEGEVVEAAVGEAVAVVLWGWRVSLKV